MNDATSTLETNAISPELQALLEVQVPGLLAQISKKINIDQLKAEAGSIGDLDIDRVTFGDATIGNIILTNTDARLNGASAFMENVRTVLELRFTLDWEIDLGWLGNWDGHENLGSLSFGMNLGNVSVPSLSNIDMHIPTMHIPNASASMQPITNLDLGGATFKKLVASDTDAPAAGFTLSGMGIGSATVENLSLPKTTTARVTLEEFKPNGSVLLPGAEIRNLNLPAAQVDNISTAGFDLSAVASKRCLGVDIGILALRICVEPVIHMDVGSMTIKDASLSASSERLKVEDIRLPVTVRGIAMSKLDLDNIKINKITMK